MTLAQARQNRRHDVREEPEVIAMETPGPLTSTAMASMMKNIIKYLMYMRGQIPCVYDGLEALVASRAHEASNKHVTRRENKQHALVSFNSQCRNVLCRARSAKHN